MRYYIVRNEVNDIRFLFSLDENECATGNNKCEQMCRDTDGSYYCECHKGYRIGADRITCFGKTHCSRLTFRLPVR